MNPTPEHLTGFFMGMSHALKLAENAKRDKALAIKQEINTLKLCVEKVTP
jgi:hypothetical protein